MPKLQSQSLQHSIVLALLVNISLMESVQHVIPAVPVVTEVLPRNAMHAAQDIFLTEINVFYAMMLVLSVQELLIINAVNVMMLIG